MMCLPVSLNSSQLSTQPNIIFTNSFSNTPEPTIELTSFLSAASLSPSTLSRTQSNLMVIILLYILRMEAALYLERQECHTAGQLVQLPWLSRAKVKKFPSGSESLQSEAEMQYSDSGLW